MANVTVVTVGAAVAGLALFAALSARALDQRPSLGVVSCKCNCQVTNADGTPGPINPFMPIVNLPIDSRCDQLNGQSCKPSAGTTGKYRDCKATGGTKAARTHRTGATPVPVPAN